MEDNNNNSSNSSTAPEETTAQTLPQQQPQIVEEREKEKEEEEEDGKKKTPKMERENVHEVYEHIADHFSGTRYKGWPLVDDFLNNLPLGSLVADVGCGNGKYLHVNSKNIAMIGCDRSTQLIGICGTRGLEAFVCDGLSVPFKEASFDAVISVAVIHHFSTPERRLQSIIVKIIIYICYLFYLLFIMFVVLIIIYMLRNLQDS